LLHIVDKEAIVPNRLVLMELAAFPYILIIADVEAGDNKLQ